MYTKLSNNDIINAKKYTLKFSTSSSENKRKRGDFVTVKDILNNAAEYKSG